jgi:hypothetical protein
MIIYDVIPSFWSFAILADRDGILFLESYY